MHDWLILAKHDRSQKIDAHTVSMNATEEDLFIWFHIVLGGKCEAQAYRIQVVRKPKPLPADQLCCKSMTEPKDQLTA